MSRFDGPIDAAVVGHVIVAESGGDGRVGLAGLRTEAWGHAVDVHDLLNCAKTDADGRFEMAFDGDYLEQLLPDGNSPVFYFRVFDGGTLLADTRDTVTWRPNGRAAHVRIVIDARNLPPDTADPAPSVVQGLVADSIEGPLAEVTVQAGDRVLQRGALSDVLVGSAVTDARGRYRIEYTPSGGKVKADLTVRALDRSGAELVQSEVWCHAPPTATVDLTVGRETWAGLSEHETITGRLGDVDLAAIDDEAAEFLACSRGVSTAQLERLRTAARVARDTRVSPTLLYALGSEGLPVNLRSLLAAGPGDVRDAAERAIDANAVSRRLAASLDGDLEALRAAAVTRALQPSGEEGTLSLGDLLATGQTERAVHQAFLERFVARAGTPQEFWADLREQPPFDRAEIADDLQLSLQLALLTQSNLPLLRQLTGLRSDGRLRKLPDLTTLDREDWRQLLTDAAAGGTVPIPQDIPGDTPEARTERYLDSIVEPLKATFPGRYLRQSIARAPEVDVTLVRELRRANDGLDPRDDALPDEPSWGTIAERDRPRARAAWQRFRAEARAFPALRTDDVLADGGPNALVNPIRSGVDRLLTNLTDPELARANLDRLIAEQGATTAFAGIAADDHTAVLRQAQAYQRIYTVAPRAEHVEALLGAGLHSAFAVARTSEKLFARELGAAFGGETEARRTHRKARMKTGTATTVTSTVKQNYSGIAVYSIPGEAPATIEGVPDLETLFGRSVLCECAHCRSVYSPAAYLVDLLQFLGGDKVRKRLLARRPDLGNILLTCENTNTTIPYIDLVNEILEWSVLERSGAEPPGTLPAHDTDGATSAELRAVPQHVLHEAYDEVHRAVYPMTLPFHRPLAVTRAYLGHLGVSREELLTLFRPGTDPWDDARVAESLGMSTREYEIVSNTAASPLPLPEHYGLDTAGWRDKIAQAPMFLQQTGVLFTDLVDLVRTWFVNRQQSVPEQRIALDAPGECDIDETTITHLGDDGDVALDRIHRFLRLWRRLGWPMADVDRALFALGATDIDAAALRKLAQLRRVMAERKLPLAEALALWAPIDTWGTDAHYLKLFRSRAVASLEESEDFRLAYPFSNDPTNPDPSPDIKDPALPFELAITDNLLGDDPHTAVVLAALRLTEPDLDLIREHAGVTADAPIDLALLSLLYRYAVVARRLRLRVADLVSLLRLTGIDPFLPQDPAGTLAFLAAVDRVKRSDVRVETLDYLYRHALRPTRGPAPVLEDVAATLVGIGADLRKLRDDLVERDDPTGEDLRAKLGLAFAPEVVDQAMAIVLGDAAGLPLDPPTFLAEHFAGFADPQQAAAALLHPLPLSDGQRLANMTWVRDLLLPWLRVTLARGIVATTLADTVGLAPPLLRTLIETHLTARAVPAGHAMDDFLALAETAPATVEELVALADTEPLRSHVRAYELLHKAALAITGLGLTEPEVRHMLAVPGQFAGFTLDGLPLDPAGDAAAATLFASWQRVADLVGLRDQVPDGDRTLVDLFTAVVPQGDDPVTSLVGVLAEVTGWDATLLAALAGPLALTEADLRTEVRLLVLRDCLQAARRVGVAVDVLCGWAGDPPDVAQAKALVQTVKARYEPERWLDIAGGLNDGLREAQRTALVDYLVPRMSPQGVETADQLFEWFLVDPGMQSCMSTSRIRLAISAVQLFVQRCLLNLERSDDPAVSVAPDDIDAEQWQWRKLYRVHEANQKMYLYAENWIEPELQPARDKSPFFRQLETELLQNELTDEYVETAYLNYLRRLDEVARLDVRAMHWETEKDGGVDRVHVVARTQSPPYRYFYRRFDNGREWSPWELVDLDIGDAPHLVLMIHNRRLQLLWTTFTKKPTEFQIEADSNGPPPPLIVQWDIQIGWSEHRQGMWSPKQLSSAVAWSEGGFGTLDGELPPSERFLCHVRHRHDRVAVRVGRDVGKIGSYERDTNLAVAFRRDGATAGFDSQGYGLSFGAEHLAVGVPQDAAIVAMHFDVPTHLWLQLAELGQKRILNELPTTARLLRSHLTDDLVPLEWYPFFLAEGRRTYFAYPAAATSEPMLQLGAVDIVDPGKFVQLGDLLGTKVPQSVSMFDDGLPDNAVGLTYGQLLQQDLVNPSYESTLMLQQELRFATFWHPHVSALVRALNRDGIPGLLTLENQDLTLDGDPDVSTDGSLFTKTYEPTGNVVTPRPRAGVDFDADGAYSIYNWELFFHAPLLIANRLRQEGRYAEARRWLHYIFDPTSDVEGDTPERFWRFKPFHDNDEYSSARQMLELLSYTGDDPALLDRKKKFGQQVHEWVRHPFEPHRIARLRLAAYQKSVVMRYIDVLLEEADMLFRRDTIESINEATQLYVLAANILGPRPQDVPARTTVAPKTYHQLRAEGLDQFSNAAVALENVLFPYLPPDTGNEGESGADTILGMGETLYFCAPNNDKLLGYWDQVEDRLFKIRHCLNIEGVARQLALFDPPIDPAALVRAAASGADLDSVLGDLFAPLPSYRFSYLLAKANELCAEVKSLGGQLLSALQSKDAEQLAHLRSVQEGALLAAVKAVKEQQIDEATSAKVALEKSKAVADRRHAFYAAIDKVSSLEHEQLERLEAAQTRQELANAVELGVSAAAAAPEVKVGTSGSFGSPVATVSFGRDNAVPIAQSASKVLTWMAGYESYKANMVSIKAGHDRRWDDWKLQEDLAELESAQIQQQIDGAELRRQIAEKELANHELQMEHASATEEILRRKFTNEELYGWMLSQVSALFFQAYKLAYDVAKRAERAYRFERGLRTSNFVTFGYWDGLRKGLLAGERLSLDLKRLDTAYMEQNRRDYELSLRVPLSQWDPQALVQLQTTGTCEVDLTEQLYDANCPGHYFRRIKSLGLTVACVTGPYANVNATVTMLGNRIRISSLATGDYPEQPPNPDVDTRFLYDFAANSRIATSHGNDDSGLRQLDFNDMRYLPFEGAGAVCRLRIDLPKKSNGWDLSTTSDVVLTVRYDAREGGELLRSAAQTALDESLGIEPGEDGAHSPPLRRLFSARHELSDAWHRFLHPQGETGPQELAFELTREHYPYLLRSRGLEVLDVDLFLVLKDAAAAETVPNAGLPLTLTLPDDETVALTLMPFAPSDPIPLPHASPDTFATDQATGAWRLSVPGAAGPSLPAEAVEDLLIVLTYHVTL